MPIPAPVQSVTITRAEGFEEELITRTFEGQDALSLARAELRSWARTAPEGGAYDKCDFEIRWPDRTYRGRYDLQRGSDGRLGGQAREVCAWALVNPGIVGVEGVAAAQAILDGCDLEDLPCPPWPPRSPGRGPAAAPEPTPAAAPRSLRSTARTNSSR